jgi:hypothetical protein
MKNIDFWDIKTQLVPHRKDVCPDREPNRYVRFQVFTAVTMKNGVFWDVTSCRN